jgi:hypothetical protein
MQQHYFNDREVPASGAAFDGPPEGKRRSNAAFSESAPNREV